MINRLRTKNAYEKLCEVIPGGVNSPVRACLGMGQLPMVVESARGDTLMDVDGNKYIDYCCSWGALIHGHAHQGVLGYVQKRMEKGTTFGITTEVEGELAREIINHLPSIEKIRFVSSGTEATMSVARLARAYTERDLIVKFIGNYHGHADFFLVKAGSALLDISPTASSTGIPKGVVQHTLCIPYNDIESARNVLFDSEYKHRIAAVIMEPIAGNMGVVPSTKEFLEFLREATKTIGALLIFDEVISGFRVGLGGAQEVYHVKPDLTCLGKIIGGGFPAAAFGGRREIMDYLAPLGQVFQAGTLSGNPVAMEAGLQSIRIAAQKGFYEDLERKTRIITDPLKHMIKERKILACVQEQGSMFTLFFGKNHINDLEDAAETNQVIYKKLFQQLFQEGVYIPPSAHEAWFVSAAHTDEHLMETRDKLLTFMDQQF